MAYSDGDNFVDGAILSYQQANRMKNNFRGASEPTNIQPGMLFSDSDDDKLYHEGAAAAEQILQETRSRDADAELRDIIVRGLNIVCDDEGATFHEGEVVTAGYY